MSALQRLPWGELVALLGERRDVGWLGLVCAEHEESVVFDRVCRILSTAKEPVRSLRRVESADVLIDAVGREGRHLVVAGLDGLGVSEWKKLDRCRSNLVGRVPWTMIVSGRCVEVFARSAPHVCSMMGALLEVHPENASLSAAERGAMIASLEAWSGMSSAELLRLAAAGKRPGGADYVAWLVLLERGDLL